MIENAKTCSSFDNKRFDQLVAQWRQLLSVEDLDNYELFNLIHRMMQEEDRGLFAEAKQELRELVNNKMNRFCNQESTITGCGKVDINIEYTDGSHKLIKVNNTILRAGKVAMASVLTNDINDAFDFYIESMVFGTNGTSGGTPKFVDENRSGLFGTTLLTKPVLSSIDTAAPTTAILTSVIPHGEGNGSALSEMGLKMKSGDLYSMLSFPDLNKTSSMQLTFNWRISIL